MLPRLIVVVLIVQSATFHTPVMDNLCQPVLAIFMYFFQVFWTYVSLLQFFAQMLEIVTLSDLVPVLCAKKFSFAPQGGFTLKNAPFQLKWLKNGTFELISSKPRIRFGPLGAIEWANFEFDFSQCRETTALRACLLNNCSFSSELFVPKRF